VSAIYSPNLKIKLIIQVNNYFIYFLGPLGSIILKIKNNLFIKKKLNTFYTINLNTQKNNKFNFNLFLSTNKGLQVGFKIYLELIGTGFKVNIINNNLEFDVGFSHKLKQKIPANCTVFIKKNRLIKIFSNNLIILSQYALMLHKLKKPEVYKGKGIRYFFEILKLKQGKKRKK